MFKGWNSSLLVVPLRYFIPDCLFLKLASRKATRKSESARLPVPESQQCAVLRSPRIISCAWTKSRADTRWRAHL